MFFTDNFTQNCLSPSRVQKFTATVQRRHASGFRILGNCSTPICLRKKIVLPKQKS